MSAEPIRDGWSEVQCSRCGAWAREHERLGRVCATCDERLAESVRVYTVADLLALKLQPRQRLLEPWLTAKSLSMLYAPRGSGKTHVALGIAFAVATGGEFLRWRASSPAGVLVVDGEMPLAALQERLAFMSRGLSACAPALRLLAADAQDESLPSLAGRRGQELVEATLDPDDKLLVIDNVSSLMGGAVENEAEGWAPIQDWLLGLRRQGLAVVLVHHAGKGGNQRGTSKREDVLDVVLALRRPSDYNPSEGARFEVHFEKSRGLAGPGVAPFEAALTLGLDGSTWATRDLEGRQFERAVELFSAGGTVRDVQDELKVSRATAFRFKQRAREEGSLTVSTPRE